MSDNTNLLDEQLKIFYNLIGNIERTEVFEIVINYLKDKIPNTGCSIFLVDPMKDELNLMHSSHINAEIYIKCNYKRGEGFTGWVFKHKRLLYIPDEEDLQYIHKIDENDPPRHAGKNEGKCVEIENNGPYMATPILNKDYVIGVIRMCADASIKCEFNDNEKKIFRVFAERLSEVICNANLIEKQKKLIEMYSEIATSIKEKKDIKTLLDKIVSDIPYLVGGGGCSIFMYEGEKTSEGNKKFVLKASNSVSEEFCKLIKTGYYYEEFSPGLTSWVATTGIPVKLNNINDSSEIENLGACEGYKPIHHKSPCEIDNIGSFMAVPINESDPIGVIRMPRHEDAQHFEDIDLTFLTSLSNHISLIINTMYREKALNEIKEKRNREFEEIFSKKLIEKCNNISELSYSEEIKNFLIYPNKDTTIENAIMETLSSIWNEKCDQLYSFRILEDFKEYEKMLFDLPRYRDHFIHQFQVFLLGSIIIDEVKKISRNIGIKNFAEYYCDSIKIDYDENSSLADISWFITSTFHDVAYPIQKSEELFNKFFEKFMGIDEKIVERIGLEKIGFNSSYSNLIDQLCDFYYNLDQGTVPWAFNATQVISTCINRDFRDAIYASLLKDRDHGILGSLILLYQSDASQKGYSTMTFPSALAIAMHAKLIKELNADIIFEKNPLSFLLIYCDLMQEWGRGEKGTPEIPTLIDIKITPTNNSIIDILLKIKLGDPNLASNKRKEAINVFSKLKSNKIRFRFEIANSGEKFESRGY
ncbi:MAG: GAF domain-containing protein [Methanotrichaceae archaeon]|nr:GAF domain-containing protein [Methanotrichaceae archaeon]